MPEDQSYAGSFRRYDSVAADPVTPAEYRAQISKLNIEVEHIENQLNAAKLSIDCGQKTVEPGWLRRTGDALRHKREAMLKLESELDLFSEKRTQFLIEAVREEFDDNEWAEICQEVDARTSKHFQAS